MCSTFLLHSTDQSGQLPSFESEQAGQSASPDVGLMATTGVVALGVSTTRSAHVNNLNNGTVSEQVSIDAAIVSVLSELESNFSLKEKQRTTVKAFLDVKNVFALLWSYFNKSLQW